MGYHQCCGWMWEGRRRGLQLVVFAQARWEFDLGSSKFKSTVSQCSMISGLLQGNADPQLFARKTSSSSMDWRAAQPKQIKPITSDQTAINTKRVLCFNIDPWPPASIADWVKLDLPAAFNNQIALIVHNTFHKIANVDELSVVRKGNIFADQVREIPYGDKKSTETARRLWVNSKGHWIRMW